MSAIREPGGTLPRLRGRRAFLALGAAALGLACLAPAGRATETLSLSAAINKAGRQRMLSQRIVKAYCLEGLDIQPEAARRQRLEAIALFDAQLQELGAFAGEPRVAEALTRLRTLWQPFREIASAEVPHGTPAQVVTANRNLRTLLEGGERVLAAAQDLVQALESLSAEPYARLVNISGRQRMLSQRMAKLYMLHAWGFIEPSNPQEMDQVRHEFEGALRELRAAPASSAEIRAELEAATEQWEWFKSALDIEQETLFPLVVEDASEKTLAIMEHLTQLYEDLYARRGRGS
jgi:nitrate/nitrite-specific signal transduction histidine kinase